MVNCRVLHKVRHQTIAFNFAKVMGAKKKCKRDAKDNNTSGQGGLPLYTPRGRYISPRRKRREATSKRFVMGNACIFLHTEKIEAG